MTQDVTEAPSEPLVDDSRRGSYLVAAGIFLSRIAGLVREIVISGLLGVGTAADSFKAALRIPNMLQNLLGEGVLSASFIPVYAKLLDEDADEDDRESGRLAGAVAGLLCALTAVLVVLGMLLARPLTVILTPGFEGERLDLAVTLLRIMFPGIGFLVLSAWCLGILNSHRRFFLSYVAPVLWNVAQIACAVGVAIAGASEEGIATALAWGVVLGGLLQLLVQLPAVRSLVPDLRLSLDRTSRHVKSVIRRFGTVVVGRGAVQLITYVDIFLASLLAVGAVSALSYAQVLYLLPISLFGMAVAAAELPELSRIGRSGPDAMRDRLAAGLERITFYVALAVALYVFAGDVIIGALLQRGEFDAADTRLVWYVLAAFSLGLLGTTRSRLLQNGLYALNRPQIVARIAVLRVALAGIIGAVLDVPLRPVRHRRIGHRAHGRPRPLAAPRLRAAARGRTAAARHRGPGARRGGVVVGGVPPAPRRARVAHRTDRRAHPRHPMVADRRRRRGGARRRDPGRPPTTWRRCWRSSSWSGRARPCTSPSRPRWA